jgi:hypothetical protein
MHRYTIERVPKETEQQGKDKDDDGGWKEKREKEGTRDWRSGQLIMISPESERVRDQTAQHDRRRAETLLRSVDEKRTERWRHARTPTCARKPSVPLCSPLSPPPPPPHFKQTRHTHTHTHTPLSKSTGGSQISGGDAACESSTESISQGRELVSGIVDRAIWLGSWGRRDGSWTHMAAKKTRSLHFRLSKAKRVPPNSMGTGV